MTPEEIADLAHLRPAQDFMNRDLGRAAGDDGGRVVFEGTPADLVAARSTGRPLKSA